MAETTTKKGEETKVRVKLPRNPGPNANQDEFFSVNFKNYMIKRGEYVEIPKDLAEVIENGELAEDAAYKYAEENGLRQPQ